MSGLEAILLVAYCVGFVVTGLFVAARCGLPLTSREVIGATIVAAIWPVVAGVALAGLVSACVDDVLFHE